MTSASSGAAGTACSSIVTAAMAASTSASAIVAFLPAIFLATAAMLSSRISAIAISSDCLKSVSGFLSVFLVQLAQMAEVFARLNTDACYAAYIGERPIVLAHSSIDDVF